MFVLCLARIHFTPPGARNDEAFFFLDRQQLLAAGLTPLRQFDFPYGPALLYPGYWIAELFGRPQTFGYSAFWLAEWLGGTAMLWAVVRRLDIAMPRRTAIFAFLLLIQCETLRTGGSNYTPFRAYNAAFLVVAAHWVWQRSRNPWLFAIASSAAVLLAAMCSMEQGIGVLFGLSLYLSLLTFAGPAPKRMPVPALLLFLAGCLLSSAYIAHVGMFISFRSFASGGYADPLLASPVNCLVLFAYVVSACVLYRRLRERESPERRFPEGHFPEGHFPERRFDSVSIPLVLAGCAMLPAALGRCDTQHICAATPAFAVGGGRHRLRTWHPPLVGYP